MRAVSFEATKGLDALANAEIANGKDVKKARAAALVVGRKKGNRVDVDGRGEGGDENPMTEEVQEGGQRQISEDGGEETAMEKRLWLWILEQRRTEAGKEMEERKKNWATALAVAAMKRQADEDVGETQMVDPAGGEAMGGELGKEVVEDREGAAVLAVESSESLGSSIVSPMLKVPRRIRPQLSEALSIVSSHDFPLSWPSLLPELVSNLRSAANYSTINNLLDAANSLLLKFRHFTDTSALCLDLKYYLDGFAAPPPRGLRQAQWASPSSVGSGGREVVDGEIQVLEAVGVTKLRRDWAEEAIVGDVEDDEREPRDL